MRFDRREALALLGMGAATPAAAQLPKPSGVTFSHGVASGDPTQDRLVLWTRITPENEQKQVAYSWSLIPLDRRAGGAKKGAGVTGPDRDFTVKVDVGGLDPGRAYTFAFTAEGVTSPTGLTRTLPAGPTPDVVLAVASCANYPNGYFNAYRAIADLPRVDAVLHLGDYIYEYGGEKSYGMDSAAAGGRPHDPPHEIVSLADYRRRHAQYKTDPDLQAAHALAPWIVVWDDHETANNSWLNGAENHDPATEGDWSARKAAALKAYFEWMPIRDPAPGQGLAEAALRSFRFGDLATLIMVETRLTARDLQLDLDRDLPVVNGKPDVAAFRAKLNDPARRMMGERQEAWIRGEVEASVKAGHAWQVLGNQVVMGRVNPPTRAVLKADEAPRLDAEAQRRLGEREKAAALKVPVALDMWDGYPADRERLYGLLHGAGARPIVLSGDSHSFWANDLADASGRHVACEFGATAVTSNGAGEIAQGLDWGELIARASPEVRYNNQTDRGFVLLTLSRTAARAEMVGVSTIVAKPFTTRVVKTFEAYPQGSGVSPVKAV